MAENKKSVLLYCDLIHTVEHLPDEFAGKLFKHLLAYINDQDPQTDDVMLKVAFEPIKQALKRDLKKWDKIKEKRSEAGLKSAEARRNKKEQDATNSTSVKSVEQTSTNPTVSVNGNVSVNVSVNDILLEKETKAFDLFWNAYDKKTGDKSKCKSKFLNLSEKDRLLIMEFIPKYKLSQPENKYRKDPITFLNQKGWTHEILESNTANINPTKLTTSFR